MPSAPTNLTLGGVGLDYSPFTWLLYRGTQPRTVTIQQGAKRFDELRSLPHRTSLVISDPDGNTETIACDLLAIEPDGANTIQVTLADRRWRLTRYHVPHDVNIRWGAETIINEDTGEVSLEQRYVSESAATVSTKAAGADEDNDQKAAAQPRAATVREALARIVAIAASEFEGDDVGLDIFPSGGFVEARGTGTALQKPVDDNTMIGGRTYADAIGILLSQVNLDLAVSRDGESLVIVPREKSPEQDEKLRSIEWVEDRPGWELADGKRYDAPAKVVVPYVKRQQFRAAYVSGATYATPLTTHLRLRQRYQSIYGSGWVTLAGLLKEADAQTNAAQGGDGFSARVTERIIAQHIYTGSWSGTVLQQEPLQGGTLTGLSEENRVKVARQILTSIDNSWRKHFRMTAEAGTKAQEGVVPRAVESDGYFYDIQFGSLSADPESDVEDSATIGTVRPQAVRGPYVELFRLAQYPTGGGRPNATDGVYSQNSGDANTDAPFSARWLDRADRIVEIVPSTNRLVIDRRLGALTRQDKIDEAPPSVLAKIPPEAREKIGTLFIRRRDIQTADDGRIEYDPAIEFSVTIVAKTRVPLSDRDRFHEEEIESGIDGASGSVYLEVDDVATANIDPDNADSVLNSQAIEEHARKRADDYLSVYRDPRKGSHIAQGLTGFVDLVGSIASVALEVNTRAQGTVFSRVELGA